MARHICLILSVIGCTVFARDITHFYFAHVFPGEPRFEQAWLGEGYVRFSGASSEHSYNSAGEHVPLLDIFGTHDPTTWARELPDLDPTNSEIDRILQDISTMATPSLTADANFQILQLDMQFTQNFDHGIFGTIHVPLRYFEFSHPRIRPTFASSQPQFNTFMNNLDSVFNRMGYTKIIHDDFEIGDISILLGYTRNYEMTSHIDFIDNTIQSGVVIPSGPSSQQDIVFDLPHGHYDRTGYILQYTGACGIYDWLTFGWHAYGIIFAQSVEHNRIHTVAEGQGWITPRTATFRLKDGHLWSTGMYAKADHVLQGFSCVFGYTYERKERSHATPRDADARPDVTMSHDMRFHGWSKHTFHWQASYDFAHLRCPSAPEISVFCHHVIDGHHVFDSSLGGMSIGCNITFAH